MKIAAVVLSAGRSVRMGRPKSSVDLLGETLLARCLGALEGAGAAPLIVVGRPEGDETLRRAAPGRRFTIAHNRDADRGMLSSVDAGMRAAQKAGAAWAWILPVDCPAVSAATCALLADAVRGTETAAAVPEHDGRRGHPVLLGPDAAQAVRASVGRGAEGTLAGVLGTLGDRVLIVPVGDLAVVDNVNRPGDVERLRARLQEKHRP